MTFRYFALSLFFLFWPLIAKADLFDQRAQTAAVRQEELNRQIQEQYRANRRAGAYLIAEAFGARNGGVGQFSEITSWSGGLKSLRFVTGNNHACEVYPTLDTFFCYDRENRYVRFFRDRYVSYNHLTHVYSPLAPVVRKAPHAVRRTPSAN